MPEKLTPKQQEVYNHFTANGYSESKTAKHFNMSVKGLYGNLYRCARKGYPLANGSDSKVTSFMLNKKGEKVIEWHKTTESQQTEEQLFSQLEERIPACPKIPRIKGGYDPDVMVEWKLMDHHLGLHAWRKETGEDYDIKIAKQLMINAAKKIYGDCGDIHTTAIILGGDNMHADSRNELTERGKNKLDVDSRFDKSVEGIIEGTTTAIDIAASKSRNVIVKVLSGNHDWHSAKWLSWTLRSHYRNIPQVHIDCSPMQYKFLQWGVSYFMYAHGDKGTDKRVASFLLNHIIKNNIQDIEYKYVRLGHLHKSGHKVPDGLVEEDGVYVERFPTLAAADSYAVENAFQSTRATVVTKFHKKYGDQGSRPYKIAELMA